MAGRDAEGPRIKSSVVQINRPVFDRTGSSESEKELKETCSQPYKCSSSLSFDRSLTDCCLQFTRSSEGESADINFDRHEVSCCLQILHIVGGLRTIAVASRTSGKKNTLVFPEPGEFSVAEARDLLFGYPDEVQNSILLLGVFVRIAGLNSNEVSSKNGSHLWQTRHRD